MDFHPNMLSRQGSTGTGRSANGRDAGFHPGMLGRQQLAGLGDTQLTPAPVAAPAAFGFDPKTGILNIGGNQIKLVTAVLSALAVKVVFFSGKQVAKGAKHLAGRLSGRHAAVATNPGKKSEKPWQAVRFNPGWRKIATKRHRTKAAASKWSRAHGGLGRTSFVG